MPVGAATMALLLPLHILEHEDTHIGTCQAGASAHHIEVSLRCVREDRYAATARGDLRRAGRPENTGMAIEVNDPPLVSSLIVAGKPAPPSQLRVLTVRGLMAALILAISATALVGPSAVMVLAVGALALTYLFASFSTDDPND